MYEECSLIYFHDRFKKKKKKQRDMTEESPAKAKKWL